MALLVATAASFAVVVIRYIKSNEIESSNVTFKTDREQKPKKNQSSEKSQPKPDKEVSPPASSKDEAFKLFESPKYNFSARFPDIPETKRETLNIYNHLVPSVSYFTADTSKKAAYIVSIIDISSIDREGVPNDDISKMFDDKSLEIENGKFISSQQSSHKGIKAIDVHYLTSTEGGEVNYFVRVFAKSTNIYKIANLGTDKSEFDAFTESFNFIQ